MVCPVTKIAGLSELREIPDNQEIFAHSWTDQSIIVELLEYQAQVADADAARYHFDDIASSNEASGPGKAEILMVEPVAKEQLALQECESAWLLSGQQLVAKFNEQARNLVTLHLCLLRLPQFSTDLLLTFNNPTLIHPSSSSSTTCVTSEPEGPAWTLDHFRLLLQTLRLCDTAIFG
ncbi:ran guanine nucleotide release factor isoform X2 [Rhinatrema bivittatum]|uniref:ran guanine nucleotide release factor isoform X2 n=1 Tax=Rhinatrema bivittatum TaxID=194408 RepID=UPI00112E452C|nr:ran guanine nucleotide release factor isoform X2 [Rhinatrema bivittatum]